jgi:hypothetical protein
MDGLASLGAMWERWVWVCDMVGTAGLVWCPLGGFLTNRGGASFNHASGGIDEHEREAIGANGSPAELRSGQMVPTCHVDDKPPTVE